MIWRLVVPYREYYERRSEDKPKRVKPGPHSGLLLTCRQTFDEANVMATRKTLNMSRLFYELEGLDEKFGGELDEVVIPGSRTWLRHHGHDLLQVLTSDELTSVAIDTIKAKRFYSKVSFDRFLLSRVYDEWSGRQCLTVSWILKVNGPYVIVRSRLRSVLLESDTAWPNVQGEKAVLEARGIGEDFKDFLRSV